MRDFNEGDLVYRFTMQGVLWGRVTGYTGFDSNVLTITTYQDERAFWWDRENIERTGARKVPLSSPSVPDHVRVQHTAWLLTNGESDGLAV